jgi:hypothetical protein
MMMLLIAAQKIARFSIAARRIRRQIGLEPRFEGVVIGDRIQHDGSVDHAILTSDQNGDEGCQRAQQKRRRRRLRNDV